ncbi:hypothetical protein ODS22_19015, partial [Escherichia coli]|nr:hypothetical protein [Escherichia coli]
GGTADRNRSHWSTSKTPSYTKSVSWQHHRHITSISITGSIQTGAVDSCKYKLYKIIYILN